MLSFWPTRKTASLCFLGLFLTTTAGMSGTRNSNLSNSLPPLAAREQNLRRAPAHMSEFAPIYASAVSTTCASTRLPEALLTPDPVMQDFGRKRRIRVSFIVGADGRVHSAFILDSGGRNQDRTILGAVGHWRYRPALCNGVPTPMEARISFVLR